MARGRHIGGDEDDDAQAMQYFFGGGRGGGDINPMALAMQLLGMGQKAQEFQTSSGLNREEMESVNKYRQGQLDVEREKMGAESGRLAAAEKLERDKLAATALQNRVKFAQDLLTDPNKNVPQDVGMGMLEGLPAEYSDPLRKVMDARMQAAVEKWMPAVHAAYGDPRKTAAALKVMFEHPETVGGMDVLKRMPWQQWNEEMGQQAVGSGEGYRGALSKPWQEYQAPEFPLPNPWATQLGVISPDEMLPWQRPEVRPPSVNPALPWR
jgi:hypothetical protein